MPSVVCHVRVFSGSLPLSCFLASSVHLGSNGALFNPRCTVSRK
jgi:hypothetical protein